MLHNNHLSALSLVPCTGLMAPVHLTVQMMHTVIVCEAKASTEMNRKCV